MQPLSISMIPLHVRGGRRERGEQTKFGQVTLQFNRAWIQPITLTRPVCSFYPQLCNLSMSEGEGGGNKQNFDRHSPMPFKQAWIHAGLDLCQFKSSKIRNLPLKFKSLAMFCQMVFFLSLLLLLVHYIFLYWLELLLK